MMPGRSAFGSAPWTRAAYSNQATQSLFQGLLKDPEAERRYLLEVAPFDWADTDAVVNLKYADDEVFFTNADGDYKVRLKAVIDYTNAIEITGVSNAGSTVNVGPIEIAIEDDDDDSILEYYWDCRTYEVFLGAPGWARSEYGTIQKGEVVDVEWSEAASGDTLRLLAQDATLILQQPLSPTRYLGTGGIEGTEDMEGLRLPLSFGECKNITPKRIDQVLPIYQWHDPASISEALDNAYDIGYVLTPTAAGEVADVFVDSSILFTADDIENDRYVYDLANSVIRLSAEPQGLVTLDVKGDANVAEGGYVSTPADIAHRMARLTGILATKFDEGSRTSVNRFASAPIGYFSPAGSEITMLAAMNAVMETPWGRITGSRSGLIRFVRIQIGDLPPSRSISNDQVQSAQRVRPPASAKTLQVRYDRAWTVQPQGTLGLKVPVDAPAHAAFIEEALRSLPPETDAATTDDRNNSKDVVIDTLFVNTADAQAEQTRRFNLLKGLTHYYVVSVTGHMHRIESGDLVNLQYDRWGLENGKPFVVRSVNDNSSTQTTRLELWG